MNEWLVPGLLVLIVLLLSWLLLQPRSRKDAERLERELRSEVQDSARGTRQELAGHLSLFQQTLLTQSGDVARTQNEQIDSFRTQLAAMQQQVGDALHAATRSLAAQSQAARDAQDAGLKRLSDSLGAQLQALSAANERRLAALQEGNEKKLEQMRATVDEKLHATLEQRLGESFKQVADRLEQVHKGLGEMQTLATGVGDLKRVLTNVKSRGGWGEVQLATLLAEMLSPAQYAQNVATRPGRAERVEFAIRFPGRSEDGAPCWLPIDAKFPLEDYQRLQEAIERADAAAVEASRKALDVFFRDEAKKIRDKYVEPPHTTDFAILFVPTEGLYAEAVSRPGLADALQRDYRVMLAGPMNLAAMLNSLQLGFRTLAIEQRSTEVWRVLGAVKTEFGKFGDILAKTKEKLDQVGRTLDDAGRKSTTIARKLRDVEALPESEADRLLTGDAGFVLDAEPLPPPESK